MAVVTRPAGAIHAAAFGAAFFMAAPAFGHPLPCEERAVVLRDLGRDYAEAPIARALTRQGAMIEVYATIDGATWTMLVTLPSRPERSCVAFTGEAWEAVRFVAPRSGVQH